MSKMQCSKIIVRHESKLFGSPNTSVVCMEKIISTVRIIVIFSNTIIKCITKKTWPKNRTAMTKRKYNDGKKHNIFRKSNKHN